MARLLFVFLATERARQGGIIARFVIDDTSICFINCHLAAGQSHVRQRNADVAAFLEDKELFPEGGPTEEPVAFVNGGDGTMVLDHEIVFVSSALRMVSPWS